jgi:hypothetical protein
MGFFCGVYLLTFYLINETLPLFHVILFAVVCHRSSDAKGDGPYGVDAASSIIL